MNDRTQAHKGTHRGPRGLNTVFGVAAMCWSLAGCDVTPPAESTKTAPKLDTRECDCKAEAPRTSACVPRPRADKGDIKLTFKDPKNTKYTALKDLLQGSKLFERLVLGLNETMAFPRPAAVLITECGEINAYYDSKAPGVVICYEMVEHFRGLFAGKLKGKALDDAVLGAIFFAFMHEMGHALVDQLQLPVTGKEEDAVDQLAAVILISSGSGLTMALDGARAFLLNAKKGFSDSSFWDEHSFEEQRYYSILCMAYGAAPKQRARLVGGKQGLPKERAKSCPAEYARIKSAWEQLLAPHAKG